MKISKNGGFLRSVYATEEPGGALVVRMYVTTENEVRGWEYDAAYDYYDTEIYDGLGLTVSESEGDEYPVWEISFPFIDNTEKLGQKIDGILNLHKREITEVLEAIKHAEGEYNAL